MAKKKNYKRCCIIANSKLKRLEKKLSREVSGLSKKLKKIR